jgi:WD40 repeat protein
MGWHARVCAHSPDGKFALLRIEGGKGKGLELWSTQTSRLLGRLPPPEPAPHAWYRDPVFSPDGKRLLTICEIKRDHYEVRAWDVPALTPRAAPLRTAAWYSGHVVFSPDGNTVLLRRGYRSGAGTELQFWGPETGRLLGAPFRFPGITYQMAFSPDGRLVAVAGLSTNPPGQVRLWRAPSGQPVGPPLVHQRPVRYVAFSPDGKRLLTAGPGALPGSGEARLWDVRSAKPVGGPIPLGSLPSRLAFSPTGDLFAVAAMRGAHLFRTPAPVAGDVEGVTLWAQVLTGLELDADGNAHVLSAEAWRERRQRLHQRANGPLLR